MVGAQVLELRCGGCPSPCSREVQKNGDKKCRIHFVYVQMYYSRLKGAKFILGRTGQIYIQEQK